MEIGHNLSLLYCIPFLGMLVSIAVLPLVNEKWWEKNRKWMVIFWSLTFLIPFGIKHGGHAMTEYLLDSMVSDYLGFIVLLFGLYCVAGNITIDENLGGSPKVNTAVLMIGMLLASWIGTTGASMILIRPLLRANKWRKHTVQTFVFFIFLVSNMGGALTPVGDPPILMGFMRHVPFFWSFNLLPIMVLNGAILLTLYYFIDRKGYTKDLKEGRHPEIISSGLGLRVRGAHNIVFLGMIILGVVLSGVLAEVHPFSNVIPIFGEVSLSFATILELVIILVSALLSYKTTGKEIRKENDFSWGAIKEVAVLFIGIFITMIPALIILEAKGASLGLTKPWEMFWMTGLMSSFLDNTPTYLVFLTTAGTLGASTGIVTTVGVVSKVMLVAISCGAVFMGANTYIGNAPNFMVKSIAEESGVKMPSFFGYMWWSARFLIPIFILDTLLFFLVK